MSKTTKIVVLINVIASLVLVIIISSTLYAWYVRTSHTESVDVSTNGIVLSYEIDEDSTTINTPTYSIEDLVFFDLDNDNEGKYFSIMAHCIKVEITNKSKKKVDITLSYKEPNSYANPFAVCAVSTTDDLDSTDSTTSVYDYLVDNDLATITYTNNELTAYNSSATISNIVKDSKVSFYVYIFGVQPDDDATNDFLYEDSSYTTGENYTFDLEIFATVSEGQAAEIVEDSSTESSND